MHTKENRGRESGAQGKGRSEWLRISHRETPRRPWPTCPTERNGTLPTLNQGRSPPRRPKPRTVRRRNRPPRLPPDLCNPHRRCWRTRRTARGSSTRTRISTADSMGEQRKEEAHLGVEALESRAVAQAAGGVRSRTERRNLPARARSLRRSRRRSRAAGTFARGPVPPGVQARLASVVWVGAAIASVADVTHAAVQIVRIARLKVEVAVAWRDDQGVSPDSAKRGRSCDCWCECNVLLKHTYWL